MPCAFGGVRRTDREVSCANQQMRVGLCSAIFFWRKEERATELLLPPPPECLKPTCLPRLLGSTSAAIR
jgi:hypothetical protein